MWSSLHCTSTKGLEHVCPSIKIRAIFKVLTQKSCFCIRKNSVKLKVIFVDNYGVSSFKLWSSLWTNLRVGANKLSVKYVLFFSPLPLPLPSPPSKKQAACVERHKKEGNGSCSTCSTSYSTAPRIADPGLERELGRDRDTDCGDEKTTEVVHGTFFIWNNLFQIFCKMHYPDYFRCIMFLEFSKSSFFQFQYFLFLLHFQTIKCTCIWGSRARAVEPPSDYETNTQRFKSIDQWCLNIMMSIPNESDRDCSSHLTDMATTTTTEQSRRRHNGWNK